MKIVIKHIVYFCVLFLLVFPQRAEAYLDPGTGSYLLQIMVAALFGGAFIIKTWWRQIKDFVNHTVLRKKEEKSEEKGEKKSEKSSKEK